MNKVHFSSDSVEWETPQALFDSINEVVGFDLDVCATLDNAKCDNFHSPEQDGLSQEWHGFCWMNPPYGRAISKWMCKAETESRKHNATVVCLVPARTDTAWWHNYALKGQVLFIRGRLKFGGHNNFAPFPSAIVILGGNKNLRSRLQQHLTNKGLPCQ